MKQRELKIGDVVQIKPDSGSAFDGCFMVVSEPRSWGAQGYINTPIARNKAPSTAYFRASWDIMEYVGHATWVIGD